MANGRNWDGWQEHVGRFLVWRAWMEPVQGQAQGQRLRPSPMLLDDTKALLTLFYGPILFRRDYMLAYHDAAIRRIADTMHCPDGFDAEAHGGLVEAARRFHGLCRLVLAACPAALDEVVQGGSDTTVLQQQLQRLQERIAETLRILGGGAADSVLLNPVVDPFQWPQPDADDDAMRGGGMPADLHGIDALMNADDMLLNPVADPFQWPQPDADDAALRGDGMPADLLDY